MSTFRKAFKLTLKEIHFLAEQAASAPSGDNCQPFQLEFSDNQLFIWHNSQKAKHAINYKNHASILALGGMIEILSISASYLGLSMATKYPNCDFSENPLWASITFSKSDLKSDKLVNSIQLRSVDRRPFRKKELDFKELFFDNLASRQYGNITFSQAKLSLCNIISHCENYVWETKRAYIDLFSWSRLTETEYVQTNDGLSAKNMGMNIAETAAFRLLRRFPSLLPLVWSLGMKTYFYFRNMRLLRSSGGFIVFSSKSNDPIDLLNIGRRSMRFWLKATQLGYSVQPVSVASFVVRSACLEDTPGCMKKKQIKKLKILGEKLGRIFKFSKNEQPVWMFRFGPKPKGKDIQGTKRKPINQFYKITPCSNSTPSAHELCRKLEL